MSKKTNTKKSTKKNLISNSIQVINDVNKQDEQIFEITQSNEITKVKINNKNSFDVQQTDLIVSQIEKIAFEKNPKYKIYYNHGKIQIYLWNNNENKTNEKIDLEPELKSNQIKTQYNIDNMMQQIDTQIFENLLYSNKNDLEIMNNLLSAIFHKYNSSSSAHIYKITTTTVKECSILYVYLMPFLTMNGEYIIKVGYSSDIANRNLHKEYGTKFRIY